MQDPIGSFLRIRELYLRYLDTAFRIGDESVDDERRRLLRSPGTLCTEPLVEPLPRYEPSQLEFHELITPGETAPDPLDGFDASERRAFVELLLSGLFPSTAVDTGEHASTSRIGLFKPYTHQMEMLRRGTKAGLPGIVTSGTGSGKTESFLLPILAAMAKEAKRWPAPHEEYLQNHWWHDPHTGRAYEKYTSIPRSSRPTTGAPRRNAFRPHRRGETRDAAVRALIIYPMNALVEDQLVRLRKALDSREAREVMDREFGGNRVFFGRYTGKTPVTGHEDDPGFRELLDTDKDDADLRRRVYFPAHKRADQDGTVSLADIWDLEFARRKRKQAELFKVMVDLEKGQRDARHHATGDVGTVPSAFGEEAPFMFPAVDGGELVSRWDMQRTPPDILVTNVSMLGAMLTREVDESIFSQTRAWLQKPDSYFYLVLDELHLQRGSAGTEVAYLIRLLLDRLGLTSEEHRHKLRVLASSASLPASSEKEATASADYLWDMFGRFGLPAGVSSEEEGRNLWLDAIVPGVEVRMTDAGTGSTSLRSGPYLDLLTHYQSMGEAASNGSLSEAASATNPASDPEAERLWRAVAGDLGIGHQSMGLGETVDEAVRKAAACLVSACWEENEQRTRATPVGRLAHSLFEDLRELGGREDVPYDRALQAVRALSFVRGCGDGLADFVGKRIEAPSFRVHTFFRSIEGLYAPAWKNAGVDETASAPNREAEVGRLSIERETRKEFDIPGVGAKSLRQLEMLYCECCGELFFGGMRSKGLGGRGFLAELLPYEPQIDGLPDAAASQRFEELSFDQYAVFWPTADRDDPHQGPQANGNPGTWLPASLDRETGVVSRRGGPFSGRQMANGVRGYLYERSGGPGRRDRHRRRRDYAETHVPYACPACGTDYYFRRLGMGRLSPVRNFRAGFAKTTQLLATELFDAQRVANPEEEPKLVSFADSRQDAARAALDIERNHHQDMRRELLVANLERFASSHRRDFEAVRLELDEANAAVVAAGAAGDTERVMREAPRVRALQEELEDCREPSVAVSSVLEHWQNWDPAETGSESSWLIADMVRRGVHPYDAAGVDRPVGLSADGKRRWFDWDDLFEVRADGSVYWNDEPPGGPSRRGAALHSARRTLVYRFYQAMSDVIFSKTYFSLEESGLSYVTIDPSALSEEKRGSNRVLALSALVRVIADSYRYRPSRYREEDDLPASWTDYGDVRTARAARFAEAVWGESAEQELMKALRDLGTTGHAHGVIDLANIRIMPVGEEDPYWRCDYCSRVHLHRGAGVCTRCFRRLPEIARGSVEELRRESFLATRVLRAIDHQTVDGGVDATFRLHCEELTGQTEDPARRQREFRGIFVPQLEEVWDEDVLEDAGSVGGLANGGEASENGAADSRFEIVRRPFEAKDTIDLLAVTTTMEVGIDVGPLQTVLQSNMPPQRFNYQQRVGRAGRRGQAFSMALTICRTRSHDIHYFREPRAITGDVPPTPFLTRKMADIAVRFLRKRWLTAAFARLRSEERRRPLGIYPGDLMSPPDIHGEFMPVDVYLQDPSSEWQSRLRGALEETEADARDFLSLLNEDDRLEELPDLSVEDLLDDIRERLDPDVAHGLANSLAELGLLPMFGMPTRVRNLYLDVGNKRSGPDTPTIDRDLDMAIYEFAPGAKVVKDKYEHLCVGFTPDLGLPEHVRRNEETSATGFQDRFFGERFRMVQCATCSAWARLDEPDVDELRCGACEAILSGSDGRVCVVPHAFRTDLKPRPKKEEGMSGSRHRSVQAEGQALSLQPWRLEGSGNGHFRAEARIAFDGQARTYRLNRGPKLDDEARGFEVAPGSQRVRLWPGHVWLPHQAVVDENSLDDYRREGDEEVLWLAAPKTTDSLYISPSEVHDGLALHRLPARAEDPVPHRARRWQGVRAAALSATFLVVDRASLALDIDPTELEVLEPRPYGTDLRLPLIQITDELVNGAGFCRNLSEPDGGAPKILKMMHSMLSDPEAYPLRRLLHEDHRDCETACYRCLLRYGNQQFHGLLDWPLGLSYLRTILDPRFACGLDGDFAHPGIDGWRNVATRLAEEMEHRFGGETRSFAEGVVPAFRVDLGGGKTSGWVLVAHPLWDWSESEEPVPDTVLAIAEEEASEEGPVDCWDTFNLARRPVQVREWIRGSTE